MMTRKRLAMESVLFAAAIYRLICVNDAARDGANTETCAGFGSNPAICTDGNPADPGNVWSDGVEQRVANSSSDRRLRSIGRLIWLHKMAMDQTEIAVINLRS
ncbi:hypothetical protein SAMN04488688_101168 [Paenibacillus sp. cl141a]|nr:hypothetical protein SAMN04488688_101168 [Paenibacillus sp. cl141a]